MYLESFIDRYTCRYYYLRYVHKIRCNIDGEFHFKQNSEWKCLNVCIKLLMLTPRPNFHGWFFFHPSSSTWQKDGLWKKHRYRILHSSFAGWINNLNSMSLSKRIKINWLNVTFIRNLNVFMKCVHQITKRRERKTFFSSFN